MFQMYKALSKHIWPLTTEDEMKVKREVSNKCITEGDNAREEEEQEGDEEEVEDEENARIGRNKKGGSNKVDKGVRKRCGFTKSCSLSPQLQEFTGVPELARTEVVKKLWAYIRQKNLQNPKDKRNIVCDKSLLTLFCVDSINMFKMNKALSKHIWPLNEEDGADEPK